MKKKLFLSLLLLLALLIRVVGLQSFPPSLYWEEVAIGYDAYSIATTGKDHHGNSFPIVAFESFGDWKPTLYFYLVTPFIFLFDLTLWSVRLPAVISGVLVCYSLFFLAKELKISGFWAVFVATLSPWLVFFSRAGWEVNLATALITGAVAIGVTAKKENSFNSIILAAILLTLAMYSYHAARIISPLIGVGLVVYWTTQRVTFKQKSFFASFLSQKKFFYSLLITGIITITLLSPLLLQLRSEKTQQRFEETSLFSDITLIQESNQLKELAGNSLAAKIFYHRYVIYLREATSNYLDHFSADFLFLSGDINPRHSSQFIGLFYYHESILLILGLFVFLRKRTKLHILLLFWLLISVIPAAVTKTTPHALRILPAAPVFILLITQSIDELFLLCKKVVSRVSQKYFSLLLFLIYLVFFAQFFFYYSTIYSTKYANEWQYGYQELITIINQHKENYSKTYITREQGRPAMYYWFFSKTDPQLVQNQAKTAKKDQGEFLEYDTLKFIDLTSEVEAGNLVASSTEFHQNILNSFETTILTEIKDLEGQIIWVVYEVK